MNFYALKTNSLAKSFTNGFCTEIDLKQLEFESQLILFNIRSPIVYDIICSIKFSIPKILKTVDAYINLVKIKTHMETTVTFSLKNQMGLVSIGDRINMHRTGLERLIAHLGKSIKPTFSIVDGIIAMEGNGPHHGQSRILDLIIAGNDMVELDSVVSFNRG